MRATITSKGVLKVSPETELENYALRKWFDGYIHEPVESGGESVLHVEIVEDSVLLPPTKE